MPKKDSIQVVELMITNKNERRKGQDRRQVEILVDEERRKAKRRDNEIYRLHELYHEGDIPIAPSYAEKELNQNREK